MNWLKFPKGWRKQHRVTVILPVYKDVAITEACIESSLPAILTQGAKLLVINDASPEIGMDAMLNKWSKKYPETIRLLTNKKNIGFTASVNKGLKRARGNDVVLLNSDVVTPRDWLQVLLREAAADRRIGTVTPLSNNSTITSLPLKNSGSDTLLSHDVNDLNQCFNKELPLVMAPTGVGFCMLITRQCLDAVGILDEKSFPRGYGEESDFCQRALKAGFLNALTPNLYCHHIGKVSFGSGSAARLDAAYRTIERLHPEYHADVAEWIERDPLYTARLIRSLQAYKQIGMPFVLHVNHSIGGGPLKHMNSLIRACEDEAIHITIKGRIKEQDRIYISIHGPGQVLIENLSIDDDRDVREMIDSLAIDFIHIHHLAGLPALIIDWLQSYRKQTKVITLHDYYMINCNPFLADATGTYVGIEAAAQDSLYRDICNHPFPLDKWQEESQSFLDSCSKSIFPSNTSYEIYSSAFKRIPNPHVVPHDDLCRSNENPCYVVATLGAIGLEKGADLIEKMARAANNTTRNELRFKIIGFAYRELEGVMQTGPYEDSAIQDLISAQGASCIFFSNRCPETYSFTLSEAMASGLPVIAPKLGVFEERLSNHPCCLFYDLETQAEILVNQIGDFLRKLRVNKKAEVGKAAINRFYTTDYPELLRSACDRNMTINPDFLLYFAEKYISAK